MPASPSVNRAKSDKLPDFEFFYSRKDKITDNWRYLADTAPNLFRHQVADSLVPGGLTGSLWWEPLFDATGKRLETIAQRFGTARWTLYDKSCRRIADAKKRRNGTGFTRLDRIDPQHKE